MLKKLEEMIGMKLRGLNETEVNQVINTLKKNLFVSIFIERSGGFEKLEKELTEHMLKPQLKEDRQEGIKLTETNTTKENNSKLPMNPRENIGKKAVTFTGITVEIKDVVDYTKQYVCVDNTNEIRYIDFNKIAVIHPRESLKANQKQEDVFKPIKIRTYDEELKECEIVIDENVIIVDSYCDDIFKEFNQIYQIEMKNECIKDLINNYKNNKKEAVTNYILERARQLKLESEIEDNEKTIEFLEKENEELQNRHIESYNNLVVLDTELDWWC